MGNAREHNKGMSAPVPSKQKPSLRVCIDYSIGFVPEFHGLWALDFGKGRDGIAF
jgi:hypothetical protein